MQTLKQQLQDLLALEPILRKLKPRNFLQVRSIKKKSVRMLPRSVRRNLARRNHDLHAWKHSDTHLMLTSGQIVVPYPLLRSK